MKKSFVFFSFIILLFLFAGFSSAYQKKMTYDTCILSYNEVPDANGNIPFAPWNEETQSGVFMKVINTNKVLGESQSPAFKYEYYQNGGNPRIYYNNDFYGNSNNLSYFPILNIKSGKSNTIYNKCNFTVGNYDIYMQDLNFMYDGDQYGVHLTEDFNLSINLFSKDSQLFQSYISQVLTSDLMVRNKVNYSLIRVGPSVAYAGPFYLFNNIINPILYNQDPASNVAYQYQRRFYPNTNPIIIQKFKLDSLPTGIFNSYSLIRENGNLFLVDGISQYIYLNNTLSSFNVSNYLLPDVYSKKISVLKKDGTIKSFPNMEKYVSMGCRFINSTFSNEECVLLEAGDKVKINFTFKNFYNAPIYNVPIYPSIYSGAAIYWAGGLGESGTITKPFTILNKSAPLINFSASEEKSVYDEFVIPEGNYPLLGVNVAYWLGGAYPSYITYNLFAIGGDKTDSLGINRLNPRISLQFNQDGSFEPVFQMSSELYVYPNFVPYNQYNPSVEPGEYSFFVQLINQSGAVKDSLSYPLKTKEFEDAGLCSNGVCSLPMKINKEFSFSFPIKQQYINDYQNNREIYRVVLYTNKTSAPFAGLFAKNKVFPYFEPGNIAYPTKDKLHFGNNSKIDTGKILLFNPSFYEVDFNLTLKSISSDKFSVNYPKKIHMYPLETKIIDIPVTATYSPWTTKPLLENLQINVASVIKSGEKDVFSSVDIPFSLNVSNVSITPEFDVYPTGITPSEIDFTYIGQTKAENISVSWNISSFVSNPEIGKVYTVNVSLIDENTNEILVSLARNYTVGSSSSSSMGIYYQFDSTKNYSISIELDTFNQLSENTIYTIQGYNAKSNNVNNYAVLMRTGECQFDETTNKIYYLDILRNKHLDVDGNKCYCPNNWKNKAGTCYNPNGACEYNSASSCNLISKHNTNDLCAWNVTNVDKKCLGCSRFSPESCVVYDNSETCNLDPCNKSLGDLGNLRLDPKNSFGCLWVDNKCNFIYKAGSGYCSYNIVSSSTCSDGASDSVIEYKNVNTNFDESVCPTKRVSIPCPGALKLSFFDWSIFVLVLIIIFVLYWWIKNSHNTRQIKNRLKSSKSKKSSKK